MHKITIILIAIIAGMFNVARADSEYSLNMLATVNEKRASRPLLKPYKPDKELQRLAELISMERASIGHTGHLTKRQRGTEYNFYPAASGEGVGWHYSLDMDGSEFTSCFLYSRQHTYAGAGVAVSREGITYYTLLVR